MMRGAATALLLSAAMFGPTAQAVAARADARAVAAQPADSGRGAGWGPFSFGMSPAAAQRVARTVRARLAPAGRAAEDGGTVLAYRGARPEEYALLEFQAGRLARVTVPLLREAAPDRDTCRALHAFATEQLRLEAGAPAALLARATSEQETPRGWSDAVRPPRPHVTRVAVETAWEEPAEALEAGGDASCVTVATHLPPE